MSRKPPTIRHDYPVPDYVYRRRLAPRELMPAVGVAVGVGLAAFYVARLFLQRTPLVAPVQPPRQPSRQPSRQAPVGQAPVGRARTESPVRTSGPRRGRPSHPPGRA